MAFHSHIGRRGSAGTLENWTPELSVDIEALDADHKAFFELAAVLQDARAAGLGENDLVVRSAIDLLEDYVVGHFLREERAMESAGYPDFEAHRLQHQVFRDKVAAIARAYRNGDLTAPAPLPDIVTDWLYAHIAKDDHAYRPCVQASHVDPAPLALMVLEAEGDDDTLL
jgi:hemerythrin